MEITEADFNVIKDQCFLGLAKIQLSAFNFDHPYTETHRELDRKKVNRLLRIFQTQGCLRHQSENFVNAVVGTSHFNAALQEAGLGEDDLTRNETGDVPSLPIYKVSCLHGLHRIRAAQRFLARSDQHWNVRLFSDDIGPHAARKIIEESENSSEYSDGEKFLRIRRYHYDGDVVAERSWWARLTETKRKDLKQLLRHPTLAAAFDKLLDIPGLWRSVQLGTLHRLHALKCDEEMLTYLEHINQTWRTILGSTRSEHVDAATVERLQLLAPRSSDFSRISRMMRKKSIFRDVTRNSERQEVLQNLRQVHCLIPSLFTFFENLKFLEPCCNAIKRLIAPSTRDTIRGCLIASYNEVSDPFVETRNGYASILESSSAANLKHWAYLQLWLFAMRNFMQLTGETPRKDTGVAKPARRQPNPVIQQQLASLALALGFDTPQARELQGSNPGYELAKRLFLDAGIAHPNSSHLNSALNLISRARATPHADSEDHSESESNLESAISSNDEDCANGSVLSLKRRCGRPFERDYVSDQRSLYLQDILSTSCIRDAVVTALFVKRSTIEGFFGKLTDQLPRLSLVNSASDPPANHSGSSPYSPDETADLRARIQTLTSLNTRMENELRTQKSRVESLENSNTNLHTRQTSYDSLQPRIAALERDLLNEKTISAQQQEEIVQLEGKISDYILREEERRNRLAQLQENLDYSHSQTSNLRAEQSRSKQAWDIEKLKQAELTADEISGLRAKICELEEKLLDRQLDISRLGFENQDVETQKSIMQNRLDISTRLLERFQKRNAQYAENQADMLEFIERFERSPKRPYTLTIYSKRFTFRTEEVPEMEMTKVIQAILSFIRTSPASSLFVVVQGLSRITNYDPEYLRDVWRKKRRLLVSSGTPSLPSASGQVFEFTAPIAISESSDEALLASVEHTVQEQLRIFQPPALNPLLESRKSKSRRLEEIRFNKKRKLRHKSAFPSDTETDESGPELTHKMRVQSTKSSGEAGHVSDVISDSSYSEL